MSNTVTGRLNEAYVSSVSFLHDRDIYNKLFNRYHEETVIDFFEQTGRTKEATQTEFHHFEKDYIYQNVLIDSVAGTPGVGNDVQITLDAANHDNGASTPKETDLVLFNNDMTGYVIAKDTSSPTAHTITVRPVDTVNDDIVTASAAGDFLAFYSNAHAEGSAQPQGLIQKPLRFSGIHQIFKGHYGVTGTEATNKIEFTTSNGKYYWMYEGEHDAFVKFRMDCAFGLLFNQQSNGLTDALGREIRVTKGLAQWIREEGNIFPGGIGALTDIDTIIKVLDKQRGSKENLMLLGINLDIDVDNVLIDKLLNGAIQYNTFGKGNAKQRAVDLGFNSFRKGSYTFHKKQLDAFNHANVTGSTGFTYPDKGFIIPTDKGRDVKTGAQLDSICLRYKNAPHMNRMYIHKLTGLLAPNPTNNIDELGFEYICEKGLQCFGLNRFVILE